MDKSFRDRRILVVDDEERMVRFIRLNLEHDGFQVVEALRGAQAIDRWPGRREAPQPPGNRHAPGLTG